MMSLRCGRLDRLGLLHDVQRQGAPVLIGGITTVGKPHNDCVTNTCCLGHLGEISVFQGISDLLKREHKILSKIVDWWRIIGVNFDSST